MFRSLREYFIYISLFGLAGSFIILLFTFYGLFIPQDSPKFVQAFNNFLGNWIYWVFGLSIIAFFVSLFYTYDILKKRKEFKEYLNSDSKAKFVKKLKDLEILADKLGPRYREMLEEKKREWKVH